MRERFRSICAAIVAVLIGLCALYAVAPREAQASDYGCVCYPLIQKVWVDADGNELSADEVQALVDAGLIPSEVELFFTVNSSGGAWWHSFWTKADHEAGNWGHGYFSTTDPDYPVPDEFTIRYMSAEEGAYLADDEFFIVKIPADSGWSVDTREDSSLRHLANTFNFVLNPNAAYQFIPEAERIPEGYQMELVSIEASDDVIEEDEAVMTQLVGPVVVTNRYTGELPTRDIEVNKTWEGDALDSVTVHLYADGVDTGLSQELSAGTDWHAVFEGVDRFNPDKPGEEIEYTVVEDVPEGYSCAVSGSADEGFTITNTQTPPEKPDTPVPPAPPKRTVLPPTGDASVIAAPAAGLLGAALVAISKRRKG